MDRIKVSDVAKKTTSVCFGGPNMDEMYMTCARNDLKHGQDDCSGSIFKVIFPLTVLRINLLLYWFYHDRHKFLQQSFLLSPLNHQMVKVCVLQYTKYRLHM